MPYFNGAPLAEDDSATRDLSLHAANATAPVTSAGPKGGLSKVRLAASGNAVRRNPGAMYGLIFAVLGVIAALAGYGMVGIAAAVLSLAAALANGRTALSCIPSAAVLVMTCVVVVVQLAAIEDWPDFGAPTVARIAVAALCAASGFLTWHLRGALTNWKAAELAEAVAMLPAIFLAGLGVWMATMPVTRATNWFFTGADNVSHSLMVGQLSAIGHLDYSAWTYPAGWLSFVSLAVVSGGDASGAQSGLLALVSTNAAMLWSLYVLVSAATSLLAMALVRQYGGHRWAASMAGLTAGAVMCWPQFFLFTMGSGFQTTIVEAFVLAVAASEVLSGRAVQLRRVVICSAALVLTANNYPLLLPPAGILWLAQELKTGA